MKEETITLNTQEQKRAMVLNRIQAGQLSVAEGAEVLDLSGRHMRRILAAYEKEGPAALAHGNRGRKPAHSISAAVRAHVVDLARTTYQGCNQQHRRDGSWSKRDWLRPGHTSSGCIDADVSATHKRACWCKSMAVGMPGLGIEAPGCVCLQPSMMPPASWQLRCFARKKMQLATFCWCSRC